MIVLFHNKNQYTYRFAYHSIYIHLYIEIKHRVDIY